MKKHEKKPESNEILELISGTDNFISLFAKHKEDKAELIHQLSAGGPKHKQIYSALLVQRMNTLVQTVKKITGEEFDVQKGSILTSHKDDMEISIPLVLSSIKKDDREKVSEALSHAPAHEIIAFNALLQSIEWSIASLRKSIKEN